MALRVYQDDFQEKVLMEKLPVIVEFYSDSCIPCKQLAPTLGELEEEYDGRIKIAKVNVNFSTELAQQYHVMSSPTILFFKSGKEAQRIKGLVKKTVLKEIIDLIL